MALRLSTHNDKKKKLTRFPIIIIITRAAVLLAVGSVWLWSSVIVLAVSRPSTVSLSLSSFVVHTKRSFVDDYDIQQLPDWMTHYMAWHKEQLSEINVDNWKQFRYLIARCLEHVDAACGGISDRLKSLPTLLLLAAQSNRILLIHWTRPAALEHFLVPNLVNFTKPSFIPASGLGTRLYPKLAPLVKAINSSSLPVLCTRLQDQHGGSEFYNNHPLNSQHQPRAFRKVFRHLFGSFFSLSDLVQKQLPEELPDHFVAAHLRTNYGNHPLPSKKIPAFAQNAVRCAKHLQPSLAVVMVADSNEALQAVKDVAVITTNVETPPLHLDKDVGGTISDYVSIFVDLVTLSRATCVAHGAGGFGRFGSLLSRDPNCFFKFFDHAQFKECP